MDSTITAVSILEKSIKHIIVRKSYEICVGSVGLEPTISCVMPHSVSFQFSSYPYPYLQALICVSKLIILNS